MSSSVKPYLSHSTFEPVYRITERPMRSEKAVFAISVTVFGIVIMLKFSQEQNAFWLISVTLSGISILLIL